MNLPAALRRILALAALLPTLALADAVWIDVRTPEEAAVSRIEGDPLVPYERIADEIARLAPSKDTEVVLYCRSGRRAGIAQETLGKLGYTHVRNAGSVEEAGQERGCVPTAGAATVLACAPAAVRPQ